MIDDFVKDYSRLHSTIVISDIKDRKRNYSETSERHDNQASPLTKRVKLDQDIQTSQPPMPEAPSNDKSLTATPKISPILSQASKNMTAIVGNSKKIFAAATI